MPKNYHGYLLTVENNYIKILCKGFLKLWIIMHRQNYLKKRLIDSE